MSEPSKYKLNPQTQNPPGWATDQEAEKSVPKWRSAYQQTTKKIARNFSDFPGPGRAAGKSLEFGWPVSGLGPPFSHKIPNEIAIWLLRLPHPDRHFILKTQMKLHFSL